MLLCGRVNPPAITDPQYRGVFFTSKDDLEGKAKGMAGTPLRIEHCTAPVGKVVSAWTSKDDGCMYALAEIDMQNRGGRLAAAGITGGGFRDFSLGYKSSMSRDAAGALKVGAKQITELSIVQEGARPNCRILRNEPVHHPPQQETRRPHRRAEPYMKHFRRRPADES